jgi:hypothetical protein
VALALPATAMGNPTWQTPSALSRPGQSVSRSSTLLVKAPKAKGKKRKSGK